MARCCKRMAAAGTRRGAAPRMSGAMDALDETPLVGLALAIGAVLIIYGVRERNRSRVDAELLLACGSLAVLGAVAILWVVSA